MNMPDAQEDSDSLHEEGCLQDDIMLSTLEALKGEIRDRRREREASQADLDEFKVRIGESVNESIGGASL
jgi:hypothetical protein